MTHHINMNNQNGEVMCNVFRWWITERSLKLFPTFEFDAEETELLAWRG